MKTAETLRAAGARGVKSFKVEGPCEDMFSGTVYKVYYEDGSEGRAELCEFEGT